MTDSLGDRMKFFYEDRDRHYLTRRIPVIIRVDGRAFHTYTKGFDRPFDSNIISAMKIAAEAVFDEVSGCKAAYIQSDEASFLLTDFDRITTEAWFDYAKSKIETIAASVMTAHFNQLMLPLPKARNKMAYFDARAWNIPESDVVNYFLWRMRDWERNSVTMYASSFFSSKQMYGKSIRDRHDMLHSIGKNWSKDLNTRLRNGTLLVRSKSDNKIIDHVIEERYNYELLNNVIGPLMEPIPEPSE